MLKKLLNFKNLFFNKVINLCTFIYTLNSWKKRLIYILIDSFIAITTVYLSSPFNINQNQSFINEFNLSILFVSQLILIFTLTGQYKGISFYQNSSFFYALTLRNIFLVLILFIESKIYFFNIGYNSPTRYFAILLIMIVLTTFIRVLINNIVVNLQIIKKNKKENIAIYGVDQYSADLVHTLEISGKYKVRFFIDNSSELINREINQLKIKPLIFLKRNFKNLDRIVIANKNISKNEKQKIFKFIENKNIRLSKISTFNFTPKSANEIDIVENINIADLLGRDTIKADKKLLKNTIIEQNICITGAGGSIGSELSRQVFENNPRKLILIDMSEPSLYSIFEELNKANYKKNIIIIPILLNVSDYKKLDNLLDKNKVDILIHAAAYKHVPLVEKNPLIGLENNILSSLTVCKAAERNSVKKVVLISSDKAVRPTNLMGASKRLAELIFQSYAQKNKKNKDKTIFCSVRFGNVVNSSGSVIPLFKKQILSGQNLTITHPKVVRYFMTIEEASTLVLISSAISKGGEIFLLDMGDPISILDLAKQMIILYGFTVRDKNNPLGDIEIKEIGLRPGEKLYEELLIDSKSKNTNHDLIYIAQESFLEYKYLRSKINILKRNLEDNDIKSTFSVLKEIIPEWEISDLLEKNI